MRFLSHSSSLSVQRILPPIGTHPSAFFLRVDSLGKSLYNAHLLLKQNRLFIVETDEKRLSH